MSTHPYAVPPPQHGAQYGAPTPQYGAPPSQVVNTAPVPTHEAGRSQAVQAGDWDKQLFDCDNDPRICYTSLFCIPCNVLYQRAAINNQVAELCSISWCCCPCHYFKNRSLIRNAYGIAGEDMVDCCILLACPPCAISQQHRQLRFRGRPPMGTIGPFGLDPASGRPLPPTDTQKCFWIATIISCPLIFWKS
eukprot:PhF_6_TR7257/c0_g1_i1/m.10834